MKAEIVIAGCGVIGASVAYHLAARGARDVLVIDRGDAPGAGSTSKATGGFRCQFDNATEVQLSLRSLAKLRRFEEEISVDSGYRPHGYLFCATRNEELDVFRDAQRVQHACGGAARLISAAEVRELNPAIGDDSIVGAAFCPDDGFLRPMNILNGYIAAAQRLGVRLMFGVEQHSFVHEGSRVQSLRTSAGDVSGDVFVEARGAWSGAPVVPMRRNIAATIETNVLPESMPMTIWASDWYHLRVRDHRVLLLWPDDPVVDDAQWLETVLRMTRERMPILRDVPVEHTWSGYYEMSPDGHALLGRSPRFENAYMATGCSGHGVMHSPALGELLAEMVLEGACSMDVSALDPGRFG
ncbi:MAG TPA: FAD-binding oxidoreductase [Thermoanaerobaculia bacterium]|nr:FAD-binding oxidoreductase [Thermoanaerobaculia bacterium]